MIWLAIIVALLCMTFLDHQDAQVTRYYEEIYAEKVVECEELKKELRALRLENEDESR